MKGTEKQIAWAEDILNRFFAGIDEMIKQYEAESAEATGRMKRAAEKGAETYRQFKAIYQKELTKPYWQEAAHIIEGRVVFERTYKDLAFARGTVRDELNRNI